MAGTPYPTEQMHRFAYTKLSESQVGAKLAASAGPISASQLSDALAGTSLRIVTDGDGPTLDYSFSSANRLTVSENGGGASEAGYGALMLDHVALFSHLVPGTQRGYHVIVDQNTKLATVVEVWFSGYEDNREVQRHFWYGYVDDGGAAPEERHALTNRVEGKGYYWKQDTGVETLEFFPSTFYSNFVELTRLGGELGFCAPSDYVRINDDLYIYQRTECEFSGVQTLYVFNANSLRQVGVRLGFGPDDELEHNLFNGEGEWLGQIAQFEPFGQNHPAPAAPPDGSEAPKGYRRVYRPMDTFAIQTPEEVDETARTNAHAFEGGGMGQYTLPVSDFLSGKEITLRIDRGPVVEYRFDSADTLRWRREGERGWTEARYQSWEAAPGVIMFGHLLEDTPDHQAHIIVADFDHGLATLLLGTVGTPYIPNETAVETLFGVIEMEGLTPPKYRRHAFTHELVGHAVTWNYNEAQGGAPGLTSMHLYTTPHSLSWIIFGPDGAGGMEWSGPSAHVNIRDGLYLAYWLEEACNGTLGTILINMKTMHDCGIGYHCGPNGLNLSPVGAYARHSGRFDVARFFTPVPSA